MSADLLNLHTQHLASQDRIAEAAKEHLSVRGSHRHTLVESVNFIGRRSPRDFTAQRKVKDRKGTWAQSIQAVVALRDNNTNKVIDRQKITIGQLPTITDRRSFLVGGREYQVQSQFRRMSGVYTRIADNGEFQAVASNERKGQLKMSFDPNTLEVTIKPVRGSAAKLNIYVLLRAAGRSDEQIEKVWGKGLVARNKALYSDARAKAMVLSIARAVAKPGEIYTTKEQAARVIFRHLREFTFDTRITQDILGKPHSALTDDALLDIGRELSLISKGERKPSSYDNIGHKKLYTPDMLLKDYIDRKGSTIRQRIKNKVDREVDVSRIIRQNALGREITNFYKNGGETQLSSEGNQTNPLAMIHSPTVTTVKGMGGISTGPGMQLGSAQNIHPSHIGFLDPIDTGEKMESGLILPLSMSSKVIDGRAHSMLYNVKARKIEAVDALIANAAIVAFPDDYDMTKNPPRPKKAKVRVRLPDAGFSDVAPSKVQYILPTAQGQFGLATNLVPFLGNNNGNRNMMAAKMATQAMSLKGREEPLVQIMSEASGKTTLERALGAISAVNCREDGKVTSVTKDKITVKSGKTSQEYNLYNNFQTNDKKGVLHHEALVKVGDTVKKGQVLADSNFTKNGTLSLGTNLRVAYVPMRGYNFEDGIVISKSAADKLTSEHMHALEQDTAAPLGTKITPKMLNDAEQGAVYISKSQFQSWAPVSSRTAASSMQKLDDSGVAKKGVKLEKGDIVIAAIRKTRVDSTLQAIRKSTRFNSPWRPHEVRWTKDFPGVVTRVVSTGKTVTVYVRTEEKMGIGDKLVGRYGNKGIVTKVLEDHEMPYYTDKKGERKHIEVAMHPAGVPGRINPGQLLELGAAKLAEKRGKPYVVTNFDKNKKDVVRELMAEMKKEGVSDQEKLIDPDSDKVMGSVITGPQYIQKLVHVADKKLTARAGAALPGLESYGYDLNNQPKQGYPSGGQAMGALGMYALLAHNARANIKEMQTHKSTYERAEKPGDYDSDDYWMALMNGTPLPAAQPTFAVRKFEAHLKGMGLNLKKSAGEIQMVPMTDADVMRECVHEVKQANQIIEARSGKPEKGGLFDFPDGQETSGRWGHLKLNARLINPVYEKPVAVLLDMSEEKLRKTISGSHSLPNGKTGMSAVIAGLNKYSVAADIERIKEEVKSLSGTQKDKAYKKLKILTALKKMNLSPGTAYTMGVMPILPPKMRPIGLSSEVGALGDVETVDINHLYRQVGMANDQLKKLPKEATQKSKNEIEGVLYDTVRAAYVEGALNNRGAPISSLLQTVTNPKSKKGNRQGKEGFFQEKLMKRRIDLAGRSVITPEARLGLDEMGMPRKMAMQVYRPFIIRELKANGYTTRDALTKLKEEPNSPVVKDALERVAKRRPVIMKRDPILHKFSVMSFYPKIIEGKAININPMVVGGFNADFDGDTMAVFVPGSDQAVEEAKRMLPSKNLFGTKDFGLMNTPSWDYAYGIWQLSEIRGDSNKTFKSLGEAAKAHQEGKLKLNQLFKMGGKKSTLGRYRLHNALPAELKRGTFSDEVLYGPELTKSSMKKFLERLAKKHPGLYPLVADKWKILGADNATEDAWSFGLKDYATHTDIRDKHLKAADKKIAAMKNPKDADKVRIYGEAAQKIEKELKDKLKKSDNRLYRMTLKSGAMGGKWNQVKQMIVSPLQVQDMEGNTVAEPIRKSYSEGMSSSGYWTTVPGVRAGTLSRARGTSEPGARAKGLVNLAINMPVTSKDCGTSVGLVINSTDKDLDGRYLVEQLKVGSTTYTKNTLITPELAKVIRTKVKTLKVRSPMTCALNEGVCMKCSGISSTGNDYEFGENVGIAAAQSLSEPLTQMSMNAFHTGGSASGHGAQTGDQLGRLRQLFDMPKELKGKATIAKEDGRVKSIEKDKLAGGHFVVVGGTTHRVPTELELKVKVGDHVTKGQPLSSGPVNPHELLEVSGMPAVKKYILEELHGIYSTHGVRRRHVEAVVRNFTNVVQVISDEENEFTPGDHATANQIRRINEERVKLKMPTIKTKPVLKNIDDAVKITSEGDFMAGLNYQELQKVIKDAATYGGKSQLHGVNPIPGVALGYTLDESGKTGRY